MSGKNIWREKLGEIVGDEAPHGEGYQPWITGAAGFARDLKFVPARGVGELVRFVPYMQAITLELNEAETQLCLMCHTSGQIIFIEGRGLGELAEQISAKRVNAIHVWSEDAGPATHDKMVTGFRFDKSITDLAPKGE